ncbi:uronate dehydrogenase [Abditibacterium utsteinense]|uniref:Uronate dehydrogenase n=1 Tax=Abditibacterium utsteinense TaxID=1960156 RepID=A0A2S8SU02_9BACT|nr:NAD(P)-dependent oxidoreductase [Abditibacterium utsteinense]PQV64266.1 uronate dehydrogenase [Abditibacterium utsteinense]
MKILLTGPSGRIGPHLMPPFQAQYELVTFDLPGHNSDFCGDLTDIESLRRAMNGVDVVVHLAATSDEAPFIEELVPNNVIGIYNVLEAARLENVRRVVFASSVQAVGHSKNKSGGGVETDSVAHPNSFYGATKVFGETMGCLFHEKFGLEFIALRLGAFQSYDSDWLKQGFVEEIWLSPRDCIQILKLAIEKPGVGCAVVNATSKTSKAFLSLESAKDVLGFEPQDDSRDFYSAKTFDK